MSANPTPNATATPRTDALHGVPMTRADSDDFARTLERELIACQNEIRGILDECAKHITLSNDFPWSEEVYCAFRAIRREIADTKKQANDEFDAIITRNMELEKQLTAAKAEIARLTQAARDIEFTNKQLVQENQKMRAIITQRPAKDNL